MCDALVADSVLAQTCSLVQSSFSSTSRRLSDEKHYHFSLLTHASILSCLELLQTASKLSIATAGHWMLAR